MNRRGPASLDEGIDFYREGPYTVFTEAYLRRRGYCCQSGCRHCPWDYRKDVRDDVPVEGASSDDVEVQKARRFDDPIAGP